MSEEEELTDPDRLLEGEDPGTTDIADAEHWLGVYAELLGFKNRLVREAETGSDNLSDDASQEEALKDLSLLDKEKQRLARRYIYWRQRAEELRAG